MYNKNSNCKIGNISIIAIILLLALLMSFQCSNNPFHTGDTGVDSSVFKYVARVIVNGGMPYKDTFDHKGPLVYIFNVAGIFIAEWRGIWVIEYISLCMTFVAMYKIARLRCGRKTSLLTLIIAATLMFKYFEGGNLSEEYALPFISISLYIFSDFFINNKISNYRLIICGLSFGAVCLLRINMVSVWLVFCVGVLIKVIKQKESKLLIRYIGFFLIGFCIIVAPVIIWLIKGGAIQDFIEDYWFFNLLYTSGTTTADGIVTATTFLNNVFVLLVMLIQIYYACRDKQFTEYLYLAYYLTTIILVSMSGRTYLHYGMIIVPTLVLPLATILKDVSKESRPNATSALVAFLLICIVIAPDWINSITILFRDYSTRNISYISPYYYEISELIKTNTDPDEGIVVCGNDDMYYNYSDRFSATKYSYTTVFQLNDNYRKDFFEELEQDPPAIIVLPEVYFDYEAVKDFVSTHSYKCIGVKNAADTIIYVYKEAR